MTQAPRAEVHERCRAKLNLFLDVVGRRPDGFHDLVTVFHELDLADDLSLRPTADAGAVRLTVESPDGDVPADATNLAARGAAALLPRVPGAGAELRLVKRIPVGGGLGGGSADAAAALRAARRAFRLGLADEALETVGASLGSDVPFLVRGGSALARGRGEVLERVPAAAVDFLLIVPAFPLSTAAVYAALPRGRAAAPGDPGPTLRALADGDADGLGAACRNALLDAARRVDPRVDEVLAAARALLGPRVHLTGSGSTFFVPLRPGEAPPDDLRQVPWVRTTILTRSRRT